MWKLKCQKNKENYSVIIDNGLKYTKAGLGGYDYPKSMFVSVEGRQYSKFMQRIPNNNGYVRDDDQSKRSFISLNYPIKHGIINKWDNMKRICNTHSVMS